MKIRLLIFYFLIACGSAYSQVESYLIYDQKAGATRYTSTPNLSLYANIADDKVTSYSIRNMDFSSSFDIVLSVENFSTLREALGKFLEWDSIARQNPIESFTKKIPIVITSIDVIWSEHPDEPIEVKHKIKSGELIVEFNFSWRPGNIEVARGQLEMVSNVIQSIVSGGTFKFLKRGIGRDEAKLLLDNTTDEIIKKGIEQGRLRNQEIDRQKQLQDALFR